MCDDRIKECNGAVLVGYVFGFEPPTSLVKRTFSDDSEQEIFNQISPLSLDRVRICFIGLALHELDGST